MTDRFAGVILAAGQGTRMRSRMPKVLSPLLGRALVEYPLRLLQQLGCERTVVVIGSGAEQVRNAFEGHPVTSALDVRWALQDPPLGTGHATQVGLEALGDYDGPTVILNGDLPLLQPSTIRAMMETGSAVLETGRGAAMTLMTLELADPHGYGRIVRGGDDEVAAIVEEADATPDQRRIREVNGGVYVGDAAAIRAGLASLAAQAPENSQGELYLPPVIGPLREAGGVVRGWALPPDQVWQLQQVNNRADLAQAGEIRREQRIRELQLGGVTVVDPRTTYIEEDVEIGQDTIVYPSSVIMSGVRVGSDCRIGPFAYLRKGTVMADRSQVGNFTEVKNTLLGEGSKAKHLSYLGDGELGKNVNIGAGTVFANYDGTKKSRTLIGDEVFVGSGTIFVAPVSVGAGARTGAGAVVTAGSEVAAGDTVIGVPARSTGKNQALEKNQTAGKDQARAAREK